MAVVEGTVALEAPADEGVGNGVWGVDRGGGEGARTAVGREWWLAAEAWVEAVGKAAEAAGTVAVAGVACAGWAELPMSST